MNRTQKEQLISQMRNNLDVQSLVVVVRQKGVTVAEATELRRNMREKGANLKVLKNTLLRLVISGTKFDEMKQFLVGPTALAYSLDPVVAAKVVSNFSGDNPEKLQIVGGWLNGQILAAADIQTLAKMPSVNELRAKIIGLLSAPATKIVRTIKEPMARVARVIAAKQ
jgi:large subunit ribosomal protein L10